MTEATSASPVLFQIDGAVATITLNRPDALNALTAEMLVLIGDHLATLVDRTEVRVVVFTGAGRAFSAGVDLKSLGDRSLSGGAVGDYLDVPARRVIELITTMPQIVIAKVNGFCFTGALELAIACDVIVVAEEAVLGDTHAKWALRPSWGMSQRLPMLVGQARARLLSYTARTFTGIQAEEWGLAAVCVPKAGLDEAVEALATEIVAGSGEAQAAYKDLYAVAAGTLAAGLDYEAQTGYPITDTDERIAAFR